MQLVEAGESDDEPAFAYTVGLYHSFRAPELITFGLRHEVMLAMLNTCGERIRDGEGLPLDAPLENVIDGYPVKLRPVEAPDSCGKYMGYAIWFNQGAAFPLWQLVWPDKQGRFPGEAGANPVFAQLQPLLP